MKVTPAMLVEALRNAAKSEGITQAELGQRFGFSDNKTKNVFSGRTPLNGDDVLRILQTPNYELPRLKKYLPYWNLKEATNHDDEDIQIIDSLNESATLFAQPIQESLMQTNIGKPISELARDVMSSYGWYQLRNDWICSACKDDNGKITFSPIAPNFAIAITAMERMGWIWSNGNACFADWQKIDGGNTGEEASRHCENALRDFILDPDNEFDLHQDGFLQLVSHSTINDVQMTELHKLQHHIHVIDDIVENWTHFEIPDTQDEYGIALKDVYSDEYAYLAMNVREMCAIYDQLVDMGIELSPDLEQSYKRIMSEGEVPYKGAALIDPILATSDRRGHLATPTAEDWKRYNQLSGNI